ncbi:MAG: hypothetical protein JO172_14650 [Hyphomicrobiales bacterium]|nr:hypothetical protein [Hyphomicrobiales bacterium]
MNTLALKLSLTPILILAASLAGRRWGEAIGGWLVGLPLTSGPVAFFLTLDQGPAFAQQAAAGSLAGTAAQACFGLAYFWAADRTRWPLAFGAGAAAYTIAAASLQVLALPHIVLFLVALAALSLALRAMPAQPIRRVVAILPLWDLPARMAVATTLVVAVTASASALGPRLSGLLATFPIFATVLTVFAHHVQGAGAARQVLRGLLLGLYGFAAFFAVTSFLLTRVSVALAFIGATIAALLVQGVSFKLMRRRR